MGGWFHYFESLFCVGCFFFSSFHFPVALVDLPVARSFFRSVFFLLALCCLLLLWLLAVVSISFLFSYVYRFGFSHYSICYGNDMHEIEMTGKIRAHAQNGMGSNGEATATWDALSTNRMKEMKIYSQMLADEWNKNDYVANKISQSAVFSGGFQ